MRHALENDEKVTIIQESNCRQLADRTVRLSREGITRCCLPLVLLCLAAICIGQTSCVEEKNGCLDEPSSCGNADFIVRIQADNPHFEFVQTLPASKDFWLRQDDHLRVKCDGFSYLISKGRHDCDFSAATIDLENCERCNVCNQNRQECHATLSFESDAQRPTLVTFAQFMSTATRTEPLRLRPVCAGYEFTPAQNSTFQLKARGVDEVPLVQTDAYVISSGAGQIVTYELKPLDQSFDPRAQGATFFSGTVPPYGPLLEDNFSSNLHISQVRVLKIKKQSLPLKGKPAQDATPARPSRLVFIRDHRPGDSIFSSSDADQCYADIGTLDGDFNLTKCRLSRTDTTGQFFSATPTYLPAAPSLLLTWVAEFRESEGSSLPPIDSNTEMLVIEFTIQVN